MDLDLCRSRHRQGLQVGAGKMGHMMHPELRLNKHVDFGSPATQFAYTNNVFLPSFLCSFLPSFLPSSLPPSFPLFLPSFLPNFFPSFSFSVYILPRGSFHLWPNIDQRRSQQVLAGQVCMEEHV